MVEVKPINISLDQHSPGLSVRTAISPTLTEEFIIHPSVYSEIKKLGHAKSDVLLNESESSLGAHAYAYSSAIFFPNVSFSNVIENSSYDLSHVKNFNTRNDLSSLIKDYKCNKIKSTKLKMNIKLKMIFLCVREPDVYLVLRNYRFSFGLYGRTAAGQRDSQAGRLWQPKPSSLRAQAQQIKTKTLGH
ncbi:hypothetical protein TNCV_2868081 [Trichonephila clavipes]|nr:hypothetical protein TNCV_2868081 [Trichonephila clavipes]